MVDKLDYAPPPVDPPERNFDRVLKIVLTIGLVMMLVTSLLLDGGRMFAALTCIIGPVLIALSAIAVACAPAGSPRVKALRFLGFVVGIAALVVGLT